MHSDPVYDDLDFKILDLFGEEPKRWSPHHDISEIYLSEFKIRKPLGKGNYSRVYLVQHETNENLVFAMKVIRKDRCLEYERV